MFELNQENLAFITRVFVLGMVGGFFRFIYITLIVRERTWFVLYRLFALVLLGGLAGFLFSTLQYLLSNILGQIVIALLSGWASAIMIDLSLTMIGGDSRADNRRMLDEIEGRRVRQDLGGVEQIA